jgi:hypothetical protein
MSETGDVTVAGTTIKLSERAVEATRPVVETPRQAIFRMIWYTTNTLLLLSILEKIEAILDWMARRPQRQDVLVPTSSPDRDPTDTLNYAALLKVCGSATNAFINLAESGGLSARRLLLLDSHQLTKHVVAEVLVDGRWIMVDPAFREILRDANGGLVARQQLTDPSVFKAATTQTPKYDPDYTYDHTAHVRAARRHIAGVPVRRILDQVLPDFENSVAFSLILERESLAAAITSVAFVLLFALIRTELRWYGEHHLGMRSVRIRQQIWRASSAFADTSVVGDCGHATLRN